MNRSFIAIDYVCTCRLLFAAFFIFLPTGSQISLHGCVEIQPVKHSVIMLFKFIVRLGSAFEFYSDSTTGSENATQF